MTTFKGLTANDWGFISNCLNKKYPKLPADRARLYSIKSILVGQGYSTGNKSLGRKAKATSKRINAWNNLINKYKDTDIRP